MSNSQTIGKRYNIHNPDNDLIGRGGMGVVYLGQDTHTNQPVAIKHLKTEAIKDDTIIVRFQREGEILRRLNHPNIVQILNVIEENEQHYIIMEYVAGGSLRELLQKEKALPVEQVLSIGVELADALARAHHVKIIHRDLKPGNILLAQDGTPRLTDFGLAHMDTDTKLTMMGAVMGTYAYLSPEAWSSESHNPATDIWAFGVLLYEMLTGHVPFTSKHPARLMMSILTEVPPTLSTLRPEIPRRLSQLVTQMLAKDPQKRIVSARLVAAELEAIQLGQTSSLERDSYYDTSTVSGVSSVTTPLHNLPAPATPFVGRAPEVNEIVQLLLNDKCRLLTLVGAGGMGKTRLALQAVTQIIETIDGQNPFTHGSYFVPLAPLDHVRFILPAIIESLGIKLGADEDPKQRLFDFLRDKALLLILDNFEHIIEGADIIANMMRQAPLVRFLTTSRESLNLQGEWLFTVTGMRYPNTEHIGDLDQYSALKLFTKCAQRVRPQFTLEENVDGVVAICQLVEGMPLALELSASWLKLLTLGQIVVEIRKNIDFLTTKARNMPARHRSVRAVFDYSWQTLSEKEKKVLSQLSVFHGYFTAEAATTVTQASILIISDLVDKSLIRHHENQYFDMHELLRQYSAGKLAENNELQQQTYQRHANYYRQFLLQHEVELKGEHLLAVLPQIQQAFDNIRSAWQWASSNQHFDFMASLFNVLSLYFSISSLQRVGSELWLETYETIYPINDDTPLPIVRFYHQIRFWIIGLRSPWDRQTSIGYLEESVTYFRSQPDMQAELAFCLLNLGLFRLRIGSPRGENKLFEESLQLFQELGDRWQQINATIYLSSTYFGSADKSGELMAKALHLIELTKNPWLLSRAVWWSQLTDKDFWQNEEEVFACLDFYKQVPDWTGMISSYISLARIQMFKQDFQEGKNYWLKGLKIAEKQGYQGLVAFTLRGIVQVGRILEDETLVNIYSDKFLQKINEINEIESKFQANLVMGLTYLDTGSYHKAELLYAECRQLFPNLNRASARAEGLDTLSNFAIALGKLNDAQEHCEQSMPLFESIGDPAGSAWPIRNLGRIARARGDFTIAQKHFEKTLDLFESMGHEWRIALSLCDLGDLFLHRGEITLARHYLQRAWQTANKIAGTTHYYALCLVALEMMLVLPEYWGREKTLVHFFAIRKLAYLAITILVSETKVYRLDEREEELIKGLSASTLAQCIMDSRSITIQQTFDELHAFVQKN